MKSFHPELLNILTYGLVTGMSQCLTEKRMNEYLKKPILPVQGEKKVVIPFVSFDTGQAKQ